MSAMIALYFKGVRKQLKDAMKKGDRKTVDRLLDEATTVVDELYEKMPPGPARWK